MISWQGTVYRFHPLFVLMMLLSALTGYFLELFTLFGVVLIHELGHVAAAKGFGWRVSEVQLMPFGGVAAVDEPGGVPVSEEIAVALAGPLQNALMALLALAAQGAGWDDGSGWWAYFLKANAAIGLFNLIPVHPLDGGRVAMALLSLVTSYYRALVAGTVVSMLLSAGLAVAAVLPVHRSGLQLNMLAIACFLLYSNWYAYRHLPYHFLRFLICREARRERYRHKDKSLAVPLVVPPTATVAQTARLFMRDKQHLICIAGERGIIGRIVSEGRVVECIFSGQKTDRAISEIFM